MRRDEEWATALSEIAALPQVGPEHPHACPVRPYRATADEYVRAAAMCRALAEDIGVLRGWCMLAGEVVPLMTLAGEGHGLLHVADELELRGRFIAERPARGDC